MRKLNQPARPLDIYPPIRHQNPEHHSSGAKLFAMHNVTPHHFNFRRRVDKIPTARPNQHMHGQSAPPNRIQNQSMAWSNPTLAKPGA